MKRPPGPSESKGGVEPAWAPTRLAGPGSEPLVESAETELRRIRIELHLGHDDEVRVGVETLVRGLIAPSSDSDKEAGGLHQLVLASALATLARLRARSGHSHTARDVYQQALLKFRAATVMGKDAVGVQSLELALALVASGEADKAVERAAAVDATTPEASELYLDLGRALSADGFASQAVDMLRRAADIDAQPHVLGALAEALAAVGHLDEARVTHVEAGHRLGAASRYMEAEREFDAALALAPADHQALVGRAEALRLLGRTQEALDSLQATLEQNPGEPEGLAVCASVLFDLGRLDEAIDASRRAQTAGRDPEAMSALRSRALVFLGRFDDALAEADTVVSLGPQNALAHAVRADALRALGRLEDALSAADTAALLDPTNLSVLDTRARLLVSCERYMEALEPLASGLALDPNNAPFYALQGECFRMLGRDEESAAALEHALEIQPKSAWALGTLGQTLASLNRLDEAVDKLSQAAELDPSLTWVRQSLGLVLAAVGPPERALAVIEQALQDEQPPQLLDIRARLLGNVGRYKDAVPALEAALAVSETAVLRADLGEALRRLGRLPEARDALERALEIDPDYAYARGTLGQVLIAQGEFDAGIEALVGSCELAPGVTWMVAALTDGFIQGERFVDGLHALAGAPAAGMDKDDVLDFVTDLLDHVPSDEQPCVWQSLDEMPEWDVGRLVLARRSLDLGRWKESLAHSSAALSHDAEWWTALSARADALEMSGRDSELADVTEKMLRVRPDDLDIAAIEARRLVRATRGDDAERLLRSIAERRSDPEAHERLAEVLRLKEDYEGALLELDAASAGREPTPYSLGTRGQVLRALGRTDEALDALRQAYDLSPTSAWIVSELVAALSESRRDLEALEIAERANAVPEPSLWLVSTLTWVLADLGDYEEILERSTAAIERGVQTDWIFGIRGAAAFVLGDPARTLADYRARQELLGLQDPKELDLESRRVIAEATLAIGEADEARWLFAELLDDARDSSESATVDGLELIGWCLYRLGEYEESAQAFADGLAIDSLSVATQLDLALVTLCAEEHRAAVSEYNRGIEIAETNEGLRSRSELRMAQFDINDAVKRHKRVREGNVTASITSKLDDAVARADDRYREARAKLRPA